MAAQLDRRTWITWALAHSRLPKAAALLGGLGASVAAPTGNAPAMLLARPAGADLAVDEFLVSEKLDGVRGYWDGRRLLYRSGAPIPAPAWFTARLPERPLDGEIWLGRGRFDELSAMLRRERAAGDALWHQVRYEVFELPHGEGGFAQRCESMRLLLAGQPPDSTVRMAEQRRVADRAELTRWLDEVVAAGGEGLMLHRADAPYVTGRSDSLLKLKPLQDEEAMVIAHLPGKGRHAGRLGALRVRTPDGRVFALGSGLPDALRDDPPPLGCHVVYRYRGLTSNGLPRFATFWRMRDLP